MGSFLSRTLLMIFGYACPAYECFKAAEKNKQEIEQLLFWCRYWILVALLTVFERVGDTFISWLPMYSEAKLALFIYLWHPKTKGTEYVYDTFFRPYVTEHETEIDRNLLDLKVKAEDIWIRCWQKAASYGLTRFFKILQYFSSHSASQANHPDQMTDLTVKFLQQQQTTWDRGSIWNEAATKEKQSKNPLPDSRSLSLSQQQHEPAQELGLISSIPPSSLRTDSGYKRIMVSDQSTAEATTQSTASEFEKVTTESVSSLQIRNPTTSHQENVSKESTRHARKKWRLF